MARIATIMVIAGAFLLAASLENIITSLFPNDNWSLFTGIILLLFGLTRLNKKVRLFT